MRWARRHPIITSILGVLGFLIVVGAIAGSPNSKPTSAPGEGTAAGVTTSAASHAQQHIARQTRVSLKRTPVGGGDFECGNDLAVVNEHTTCAFALEVIRAYKGDPSPTIRAYSPVTKKTYTLSCMQAQGTVACATGTASLGFKGPAAPATKCPGARMFADHTCASASIPDPSSCPSLYAYNKGICSTTPDGTQTTEPATDTQPDTQAIEGPGSQSHATDQQFCTTHSCIENFPNGNGYIVQCVDGEWSHSGGLSGACSDHGGEAS